MLALEQCILRKLATLREIQLLRATWLHALLYAMYIFGKEPGEGGAQEPVIHLRELSGALLQPRAQQQKVHHIALIKLY